MPADVFMPALGMAQETGKVLRWLKAEGDAVASGEPLLEVETDKVTVEIEAPAAGTLAGVTAPDGTEVPVGTVIAVVLAAGEELATVAVAAAEPPVAAVAAVAARARTVSAAVAGNGAGAVDGASAARPRRRLCRRRFQPRCGPRRRPGRRRGGC